MKNYQMLAQLMINLSFLKQKSLKKFLMDNLYRHPQVVQVRDVNSKLIIKIFNFIFCIIDFNLVFIYY